MTRRNTTDVVIAAGGLGTRVHCWSRFLPKEFTPVAGTPGIIHLLSEIAAAGPARVVVIYHPYYEPFIRWARQVLTPGAANHYRHAAGMLPADLPNWETQLQLRFVRQHGRYADVTSILNGVQALQPAELYVAFADNLYPHDNPTLALRAAPAGVSVLARPYNPAEADRRGVIVTTDADGHKVMADLIEKPNSATAHALEQRHGTDNLWLLEGRARLTVAFLQHLTAPSLPAGTEPKLSLALRAYSRISPVLVIPTTSEVIDLGVPAQQAVTTGRHS